ncbi:CoA-transferase family III domain-containing protein [Lipomyces arxii]|uniref:CoA-transferase family III domain-containing protein n=1 Tax=Lipomyces arxii TaxID=56418 RepID=UPI0034CE5A63
MIRSKITVSVVSSAMLRGQNYSFQRVNQQVRSSHTASSAHVQLPLTGIKVIDLTRVLAGPYATQILADLGAEVIKVEHVTRGDDTRSWGPPFAKDNGKPGAHGESAYFLSVNRNKKSLALNFQDKRGQEVLKALIASSDIVIENYLPGSLAKYGLSYEQLKNDKIIYASITGYGQNGPFRDRAGYDVMVEAEMGLMHITGEADGSPVKVGVAVTDLTTGLYAANSIMAAIIGRSKTGMGQYIDISLADCQVATLSNIASSCLISGKPDTGRHGTSHPSICPYQAFPTKDGSIMIGGANDRLFGILCRLLGKEEWIIDERFSTNALRVKHRDELVPMIMAQTNLATTEEWLDIFEGSGIAYAAVNDIQATLNHPQVLARNMVTTIDHPTCGPLKMINTPIKYSRAKPSIRTAPPTLGQHTDEILEGLGLRTKEIDTMRVEGVVG